MSVVRSVMVMRYSIWSALASISGQGRGAIRGHAEANGIVVFVTGKLAVDGSTNPLNFAESFVLMPTPEGSWYIHNDTFRLNYA